MLHSNNQVRASGASPPRPPVECCPWIPLGALCLQRSTATGRHYNASVDALFILVWPSCRMLGPPVSPYFENFGNRGPFGYSIGLRPEKGGGYGKHCITHTITSVWMTSPYFVLSHLLWFSVSNYAGVQLSFLVINIFFSLACLNLFSSFIFHFIFICFVSTPTDKATVV